MNAPLNALNEAARDAAGRGKRKSRPLHDNRPEACIRQPEGRPPGMALPISHPRKKMPTIPHVEKHLTATETVRDVVIGMADGLTVPFALAAGLSAA